MRRFVVMAFALTLAAPAFAAERPNIVQLDAVEGMLPIHPDNSRAFMAGLRDAFEPDFYLTEAIASGAKPVSMALANHFRLVRGDAFGDEWVVRVVLDSWVRATADELSIMHLKRPRKYSAADTLESSLAWAGDSTGKRLSGPEADFPPDSSWAPSFIVKIYSPEAVHSGVRPSQLHEGLSFSVPFTPRSAWFAHAGHAAGLLAVEALHRQSGDLPPDVRVRIDHTVRTPIEVIR